MRLRLLNFRGKGKAPTRATRRIKTPILLQLHATECGAACLGIVLSHFGLWVPLSELRDTLQVSRDGSSAASIWRGARHYGLQCNGLSIGAESLKLLDFPLILFWQFSHFVVLEGCDERYFYINDPATGRRRLTTEEFVKAYSKVALRFSRGPDFTPGGARPGLLSQLRDLLSGYSQILVGLIGCGLILSLLSLVIPISLGIFVDNILRQDQLLTTLVFVLFGAGVLVYMLALLKHRFLKRLAVRIAVIGYDQAFTRLLRLPIEFFHHRLVGDLTDRVASIDRIAKNLTERFLVLIIDLAGSVVLLIFMFLYDYLLALVVVALGAFHTILAQVLRNARAVRTESMRREQGLLIGVGMQMLGHADNLRTTGADDHFFSRWTGQQALELHARQVNSELISINTALPGLVAILRTAAILGIGASFVLANEMTLGTLVCFYILAEMFLTPIGRLLEFSDDRQALETDLHRLDDITSSAEDPVFNRRDERSETISTFNGRLQLSGHLELRHLTFGYNHSRPPLIDDFNLVLKPGQRIAVVGPSGSGKSTLARLVAGLYQPWSGEIYFDGKLRSDISDDVIRRSVAMVDQDVVLFSGTVRENITLWNPAIPDDAIFSAARDAAIHEDVLIRPDAYATEVEEGGTNFSGGQQQRIEIARALVGNPSLVILDEATSALDAGTEEQVDLALRRRGIACLIIAHRLSTVRDCDEIIVLDKGVEVQRGSHDELMADETGAYYKLVHTS